MKQNHTQTQTYRLTGLPGNGCTLADTSQPMKTVHDVCKETGITRKTLFYYDKIGLLKPTNRNGKQHGKMYSSSDIAKLKTIMAYQTCGLTLKEIDAILNQNASEQEILAQARTRLTKIMRKVERQIQLLDEHLKSNSEQ
ncbi:MerR family transcriptional regulator [Lactimicrobium massiliense]|uniref:MerR family transcriptional regulator n=1 Tax=Lactimicrobium massiliense TaxID=2161814 RepID=UPI000D560DD6|nr:MerR family transcriptional regulator [Lactimicrobium massiliense]